MSDAVEAMNADTSDHVDEVRKLYGQLRWMAKESCGVYLFIVAKTRVRSEYVGHTLINFSEWIAGRATIMDFYIKPEYRMKTPVDGGVWPVRGFIDAVLAILKKIGVRRVCAQSRDDHAGIIRAYERLGFLKDAVLQNWTKDGETYVQYYAILEA